MWRAQIDMTTMSMHDPILKILGLCFDKPQWPGPWCLFSNVTHCRGVALSYIDVNLAFFDFRTAASIAPRKKFRIRCQGEPVSKPGGISDMLRRQSRDKLESLNHLKRCPEVRQFLFKKEKRKNIDWLTGKVSYTDAPIQSDLMITRLPKRTG